MEFINNLMLVLCLQYGTLLKTMLRHRCFLTNFANFFSLLLYEKQERSASDFLWFLKYFSACFFIENEAPTEVFSYEFYKIFQNIYFAEQEHLFCQILLWDLLFNKMENKRISKIIINVFNQKKLLTSLLTAIILLLYWQT